MNDLATIRRLLLWRDYWMNIIPYVKPYVRSRHHFIVAFADSSIAAWPVNQSWFQLLDETCLSQRYVRNAQIRPSCITGRNLPFWLIQRSVILWSTLLLHSILSSYEMRLAIWRKATVLGGKAATAGKVVCVIIELNLNVNKNWFLILRSGRIHLLRKTAIRANKQIRRANNFI